MLATVCNNRSQLSASIGKIQGGVAAALRTTNQESFVRLKRRKGQRSRVLAHFH